MKHLHIAMYCCLSFSGVALATSAYAQEETRVERLERVINTKLQSQFDMQQEIDHLRQEVLSLRGTIEIQAHQMEQMLERQRKLYNRLSQISNTKDKQASHTIVEPSELSEEESYQFAVNLVLQDKAYDKALIAFKSFLEQYPKSSYSDNALYWLGQLQFSRNELKMAHSNFAKLVKNYPQSNKRSDSLLKLGIIAEREGHTQDAKSTYQQILNEYPESSSARLAKVQISTLPATKKKGSP
tara:strand:+ start:3488 stop:4210 length:723 start_codon:yes stop_codon:yes gene_type:complete